MQRSRSRSARLLLLAALSGAAACGDARDLPTGSDAGPAALATAGAPAHHQLAGMLAVALRDPAVRATVRREMQASKQVERKLHLSTFLRGPGAGVLRAMARAGRTTEEGVLNRLGTTGPLEVYFPVAAHRNGWDGGTGLIVATTLVEEAAPVGVTLDGTPVTLSAVTPPATPTLVIVPVEGFDRFGSPRPSSLRARFRPSASVAPAQSGTMTGYRGIGVSERANYLKTTNDQEAWALGLPEFEILLAAVTANGTQYNWNKSVPEEIFEPNSDDPVWRTAGANSFEMIYWNQDYGTNVRIQCLEIDGSTLNLQINLTGGTTFNVGGVPVGGNISASWMYNSGDDPCGLDYLYPRMSDPNSPSWYSWTELPGTTANPEDGTSTFFYKH